MQDKIYHTPVLLQEILEFMALTPESRVIDATCGEGGHSEAILKLIPNGHLYCIDRHEEIIARAQKRLAHFPQVSFHNIRFDKIDSVLAQENGNKVDSILADLGISLFHLKGLEDQQNTIGISYTDTTSLDMRLDTQEAMTAEKVVNTFREAMLADILYQYGEEYESRKIARAIVSERPVKSAKHLADIILKVKKSKGGKIHPATKTFQALRIFVNKELEILESFIPRAADNLKANGKLLIMSYHSLEDRIVKYSFKKLEAEGVGTILTKKVIIPGDEEIRLNRASRSAKLRVFQKS